MMPGNPLASMFGGGSPDAEGYMSNASGAFGNASNLYGNMAGYGGTNMGYWGQDNPAYHQSMLNLAQQLGQMPGQQQQAQVLGNENAGAAAIYAKARANLMAGAAASGLDTAGDQGNQSSVLGGGLSSLNQAYANSMANNATNYYNMYLSPMAQQQRMQEQSAIYGQLASQDWSQGMGALGNAAQGYMSVGQGWDQLADAAIQNQQMANQGWSGILGAVDQGLATQLGRIGGGKGGGGSGTSPIHTAPQSTTTPPWTPSSQLPGSVDQLTTFFGGTNPSPLDGIDPDLAWNGSGPAYSITYNPPPTQQDTTPLVGP